MPIIYKDVKLDHGYRIDLLVENKLVLELKTLEVFHRRSYSSGFDLFAFGEL
jgi:GxxExxY protein